MYRLMGCDSVIRISDGACIPSDPGNNDYAEYLNWLAEGNTPEPLPAPTAEELRNKFKSERAVAVAAIKVTSSLGRVFDGDEGSTQRMLEPIAVLKEKPEGATSLWVLADNTAAQVALPEFLQVLELAGLAKTALWVQQ